MKNSIYSLFSILFIVLFFTSCGSEKSENEQLFDDDCQNAFNEYIRNLTKSDSISMDSAKQILCENLKKIVSEVTPFKIADTIVERAKDSISLNGNPIEMPNLKININELLSKIFPDNQTKDYENYGMRIYPGLIVGQNKLTYIICTSTNYDSTLECNYYYVTETGTLDSIKSNAANVMRRNFKDNIYLAKKPQDVKYPNYKTSRYYDWLSIKAYLTANEYNPSSNFQMKFSYGYVDWAIAQDLYKLYWNRVADKPEDLKGFTVVLELYKGENTVATRSGLGHTSFKGGILEIGNPCPPRCKGEGLTF